MMPTLAKLALCIALLPSALVAAVDEAVLLWTPAQAAALKARLDSDPDYQKQWARTQEREASRGNNPTLINLFRAVVLGDAKFAASEKAELLKCISADPLEYLTPEQRKQAKDLQWNRNAPSNGDSHMRDDRTLDALRYDVLKSSLSAEERAGVEATFRRYIDFHLGGHQPRHPDFAYTRMKLLPNMHWPRAIGTHLLAVVLQDKAAITAMFNAEGGWKWFFDVYVGDNFYMEEFAKYYSNIGSMIWWCEGLERLGMGDMGWGYRSPTGNTMREFLRMFLRIGYPRTIIPAGMDNYGRISMGDARGDSHAGAIPGVHSLVVGHLPDGSGGERFWQQSRMNGVPPKSQAALWFEAGYARFPEDGYGFFLHAMRQPGDDRYLPSVFGGLRPIDPASPPPAAPSYLSRERGFAFLRMDESPSYWTGPRPAVALQFGMYYVHYVADCFSLLGYHAFNRPIYHNLWGAGKGYAGGHPWKDSGRGHATVTVDHLRPAAVDDGERGLANHRLREDFSGSIRFVAGRAKGIYPDVTQERALILTDEYLCDLFALSSTAAGAASRRYDWGVSGAGSHQLGKGLTWAASSDLSGGALSKRPDGSSEGVPASWIENGPANDLTAVEKAQAAGDFSTVIIQDCQIDPDKSRAGKAFYERGIGVRISVASRGPTTVFAGRPPVNPETLDKKGKPTGGLPEYGGATLMLRREAVATVFAVLHEPFAERKVPTTTFTTLAEADGAIALRATGAGFDDRILVDLGESVDDVTTLKAGEDQFSFTSHAHLRLAGTTLTVSGALTALTLACPDGTTLTVNGKATGAKATSGTLRWTATP